MSEWLAGFLFGVIAVLGPSFGLVWFWIHRANVHGRRMEDSER